MIQTGKRIMRREKVTLAFLEDGVTQGCFDSGLV